MSLLLLCESESDADGWFLFGYPKNTEKIAVKQAL